MDHMSLCVEEAVHELTSIFLESLENIGVSALGPRSPSAKPSDKDKDRKPESNRGEKDKDGQRDKTPKLPDEKTIGEEIDELILYFNHRNFEALLRATRNALDGMKRRLFCTRYVSFCSNPLFHIFGENAQELLLSRDWTSFISAISVSHNAKPLSTSSASRLFGCCLLFFCILPPRSVDIMA